MDDSQQPELSFEDALKKLEQVIASMEGGKVPLAELVTQFEEGNRLLKQCQGRLKEAELKIEQLRQAEGKPAKFEAFEVGRED
ncbi:exodeoxyribonuclease VII small subunit [Cephaloticoccus primus]|uniref:Exodeoxyribonuclease 7 small subunit n=1 Tax=Cephaloticoccus primus TaxID=1548207 RepID=A0A139SP59_9BACT|nr:exodeoxyribonuclease VII small subunit [Cephaloticoccus primus]